MSDFAHSEPQYKCPLCPMPFYSKVGRDDHVAYRHPEWALIVLAELAKEGGHVGS